MQNFVRNFGFVTRPAIMRGRAMNLPAPSNLLTYYFGNFYVWGWYMTPSKYQETHSGVISRTPSQYQLQIGWGKGAWNINASAYNFAHTSWEAYKESLSSEYYSFDRTTFGTQQHARYSVSVTYTIGYGKKVQRGNEISGSGTSESAILK